tara:strand:+ start:5640 stop:7391 length:1752 start_codon:yes stop_codon:yes gene_type:complete
MSIYDKSSLVLIPSGTKTGKVYSQKPTNGDGDFTFTRSSAATRVNADGNIEKETQNKLLRSNKFDTTWTLTNATLTSGQSGYDGSNDAWLLNATDVFSSVRQSISKSGVQTLSVYAKAGSYNFVRVACYDGSNIYDSYFDLQNGILGTSLNAIDANIQSVGGGWYKCSVSVNVNTTEVRIYSAIADNNGFGTNGSIYIQDAQLEQGLVARDYIETTAAAVEGGITDNVPRLDYTDSSCPALLLEPLRTNVVPHSEYLESLSAVNASMSANEAISPDGGNNATKLSALISAPSSQWARYFNIVQNNQKQALSIYAKAGNIDDFTITYYDMSTGDLFFNYDLGAGSVSAPTGSPYYVDADIQDMGNGWYRCIAVVNAQRAGTNGQFQVSAGVQRVVQNIGDYVYIYGYQWEQDATYATSYIPTYGSSVTRTADVCNDAGDASTFNSTEGVLYANILKKNNSDYSTLSISADANNSLQIGFNPSNKFFFRITANNSVVFNNESISSTNNKYYKIAFKYKSGDSAIWIDGIEVFQSTQSFSFASALSDLSFKFRKSDSLFPFYGNVKQILTFNTALTDTELADLTTL